MWARQPNGPATINWNHPLAKGLLFYGLPQGNTLVDLVSNTFAVRGTSCDFAIKPWNVGTSRQTEQGVVCATVVGSSGVWRWPQGATRLDSQSLNGGPLSLFVLGMPLTVSTDPILFSTADSFNGTGFGLVSDDNVFSGPGNICQSFNSPTVSLNAATVSNALTSAPLNKLHFFGYGFDGSNGYSYYQGLFRNSGASVTVISNSPGNARSTQFGSSYSAPPASCATALGIAFNRILSLTEYQQLWANPWILLNTQRPKLFIVPASGTIFSGSVSETLSAVDGPNASAVFASSLGETLTAAETQAGAAVWPVSVGETLSAVDGPSATMTFVGAASDTLSAVDGPASTVIFSASLGETLTALDGPNASAIMGVAVNEILSAIETSTGNKAGSGNTVTTLSGVSAFDDSGGVSKRVIKLQDLGGGFYNVTYDTGVSENKVDSVHREWYIIL